MEKCEQDAQESAGVTTKHEATAMKVAEHTTELELTEPETVQIHAPAWFKEQNGKLVVIEMSYPSQFC